MVTEAEREKFSHLLKSNDASRAFEDSLYKKTEQALRLRGVTAIRLLAERPLLSLTQLAKEIGHGANAIGLEIAIYKEAQAMSCVREAAQDLIIREIREALPNGYTCSRPSHICVALGGWVQGFKRQITGDRLRSNVEAIARYLAQDAELADGWIPASVDDPYLKNAFESAWPLEITPQGQ